MEQVVAGACSHGIVFYKSIHMTVLLFSMEDKCCAGRLYDPM